MTTNIGLKARISKFNPILRGARQDIGESQSAFARRIRMNECLANFCQ